MTARRRPARPCSALSRPAVAAAPLRLSPLMAAVLLACMPPAQAAPKANTVPIPASTWRISGSGAAAPVNTSNAAGGVDQSIVQSSQRGIYHWASFDIGSQSSVTFEMEKSGASALNRVTGSASASQIFGSLKATNGGEVYLINSNGILFGKGATVHTGSLIASALNISDDEFNSGLTNQLIRTPGTPAFAYDGTAEDFSDDKNFVRVAEGASLSTDNGGRIFLFAKRVDNAGSLQTPGGQTVLAAGGQIYLQNPSGSALYASEANPAVPSLRGLLVEVGAGPADPGNGQARHGSVANTGQISTPRGNATLVAMAVNQSGVVRATTSVTENGSIILRAQGNAQVGAAGGSAVGATQGGSLVLGAHSQTLISPDTSLVDGKLPTSDGNATFVAPRIDLAGHEVLLDAGAQVIAPGATVRVRAEAVPDYSATASANYQGGDASARVVLADGALIDVSGSTEASVSASRYFVTTDLLGSNDLKDAPLQKDGILYRSKVTVDVRDDSTLLGSLGNYRNTLQQDIFERLSAGGRVTLAADGAVLTHARSHINVSGGQVAVAAADVRPTLLMASDGTLYDINTAPTDVVYQQGINLGRSGQVGAWGTEVNYGSVSSARREAGYVEGRAAGSLTVVAPTVALAGTLDAQVSAGSRQLNGQDSRASAGSLGIGAVRQAGVDFNATAHTSAVLDSFVIADSAPALDAALWADPMAAALPSQSGMAAGLITDSGIGLLAVAAEGDVSLSASAALALPDTAGTRLLSRLGDVSLGTDLSAHSGSVELHAKIGQTTLAAGTTVDLGGLWVNTVLDGGLSDTRATTGGSFSAKGGSGVTLASGSLVNVSGGAVVGSGGKVSAGKAGSISLDHSALTAGDAPALVMAGRLLGESLGSGGGSLTVKAPLIRLDDTPDSATLDPATLVLGSELLTQGGFASYSLDGRVALTVDGDTTLAPRRDGWTVDPRDALLIASGRIATPSGTQWAVQGADGSLHSAATRGALDTVRPQTVALTLASSGASNQDIGVLHVEEGARINLVDQSALTLSAGHQLLMEGQATAHAGSISLNLGSLLADPFNSQSWLWLGGSSRLDVSGVAQRDLGTTHGLVTGTVLAGGNISLNAAGSGGYASTLVVADGAQLLAQGASDSLDRTLLTRNGLRTSRQQIDSAGGSISLTSNRALLLEGDVQLQAGGAGALGGSLSVALVEGNDVARTGSADVAQLRELRLGKRRSHDSAASEGEDSAALRSRVLAGLDSADASPARVASEWVSDSGAANLSLSASETLRLSENASLDLAGSLSLSGQALAVTGSSHNSLHAAQITLGANAVRSTLPEQPSVSAGRGVLDLHADGALLVRGRWLTQGVDQLQLAADGDMIWQGLAYSSNTLSGGLSSAGDIGLSARQIYPASATAITLSTPDGHITLDGGDPSAPAPLSAGGSLTLQAATLTQGGVLRAPQGQIVLNASQALTLGEGSLTSVSAAGLDLLYGNTAAGRWTAPDGSTLDSLPGKRVELNAPSVSSAAGSTVDLSAGGTLLGYEFVAGKGGSSDVFAGGNGAYALLPGVHSAAGYDSSLIGSAALGRQIEIGAGGPLPAGTYTLLPARYAVLEGAFLVQQVKPAVNYALGTAVAQADGSTWVGARLSTEGTGVAELPSTWRLTPSRVARQSSEIRLTSADTEFTDRATQAGSVAPERVNDAGTLVLATQDTTLNGEVLFNAARDAAGAALGRGGRAEFAAQAIQVGGAQTAQDGTGTLYLSAEQLNSLGADTVILGGRSQGSDAIGTVLAVSASSVLLDQGADTLKLKDLVVLSSDSLTVADGARFAARSPSASDSSPSTYHVSGDGAALRLSGQAGAGLIRTEVSGSQGTLTVGHNALLQADKNSANGTLVLDSSGQTQLAGNAQLRAEEVTLAARVISAGGQPSPQQLALTDALMAQVDSAQALTLRAYTHIDFKDGVTLGSDSLERLVLDTPRLRAVEANTLGATVQAGDITLGNSSGAVVSNATSGDGLLTLHASSAQGGSGLLHLGAGDVAVNGAAQLTLNADTGVVLAGSQTLNSAGAMAVNTPVLVAANASVSARWQVDAALTLHSGAGPNSRSDALGQAAAAGAALDIRATSVTADTPIHLPAGSLNIQAEHDLALGSQAQLDVAGRQLTVADQTVDLSGGSLRLSSLHGDIRQDAGAVLEVSAAGSAQGGQLQLRAPEGDIHLSGSLYGTTAAGSPGAQLLLDAQHLPSLNSLADLLAAGGDNPFSGALTLRQRQGDLSLGAGRTLAASDIALAADSGRLLISGRLDAGGADGGRIRLEAGKDLSILSGAQLLAAASASDGAGGRIELASDHGRLTLAQGAVVDVSAGAQAAATDGGRLLLRAQRDGAQDVAINPLGASVQGASRVDVEAVERIALDGGSVADFSTWLAMYDSGLAFVGADGAGATAMAQRLAGGNSALAERLRIHAATELRSDGDLTLALGGLLPSESASVAANGGDSRHIGDSSLTVRAAGQLHLAESLASTGADSGSIRLVAGADLSGASLRTLRDDGQGTLTLGAEGQTTSLRTGSGDILLAAAGQVDLSRGKVSALSLGLADEGDSAQAARNLGVPADSAFRYGAGDVEVQAGGSVIGKAVYEQGDVPFVTRSAVHFNQWYRIGQNGPLTYWASSAEGLLRGVGSLGGGAVRVQAGQDVASLVVLSPGSGLRLSDSEFSSASAMDYRGGNVSIQAGRDVVNGVVQADGRSLNIRAGRDLLFKQANTLSSTQARGLTVATANTATRIEARRDVTVGSVTSSQAISDLSAGQWLSGLAPDASLRIQARGGDLNLHNSTELNDQGSEVVSPVLMLPGVVDLAAPLGAVTLGGQLSSAPTLLVQPQTTATHTRVVAGQDLTLATQLKVNAAWTQGFGLWQAFGPEGANLDSAVGAYGNIRRADGNALDPSNREAVSLVAGSGDITLERALLSARPLRLLAGQDIVLTTDTAPVEVQHQPHSGSPSELTLLQAGRDMVFNGAGMTVGGPGDVVLLAGRHIDLGTGRGLISNGNNDNPTLLPAQGAALTLMAGLGSAGGNLHAATQQGFAVLGADALTRHAGDLYALLASGDASVPALGSAAALAFEALPVAEQQAQVQALLGQATTQAGLAQAVRALPAYAGLSDSQALAAYATLSPTLQQAALAQVLAGGLAGLPQAQRVGFISQLAAAETPTLQKDLSAWLLTHTGQAPANTAAALAAFDALPAERQWLWLNRVLTDEVRHWGRAAAASSDDAEKALAYSRAYAAINLLFPAEQMGQGDIVLPQSTARTVQGGDITLLALAGGVNAGETSASSKSASELGVVTVAGGDIRSLVRDDFLVNQSRVFTLAQGDVLLWSSTGDIDAGRGAKTVVGAPPPTYKLDANGRVVVDTSGSFSGSGIAVLNADSALDLYAPAGAIDAGEAGIRSGGRVTLGATTVRGADDIKGGSVQGAPVAPPPLSLPSALSTVADSAKVAGSDDDEAKKRARRARRNLLLEFLGFGRT